LSWESGVIALRGEGRGNLEVVPPSDLFSSLITMALNKSIDGLKGLKFIAGAVPGVGRSVTTILDVAIKILKCAEVRINDYKAAWRITDARIGGGDDEESHKETC
jgi:hypothetical protein